MYARNRAGRRARLHRTVLAVQMFGAVLVEGNTWIAALLRAPVYEAILAHVQVTRPRPALPHIQLAANQILLKHGVVRVRIKTSRKRRDVLIHAPLFGIERDYPPGLVMD